MSLLDRAINFAKDAYNYVVGNDNEKKAAVQNSKKTEGTGSVEKAKKQAPKANPAKEINSVTNPGGTNTDGVGDKFVKNTQEKSVTNNTVKQTVKTKSGKQNTGTKSNTATKKVSIDTEIEKLKQKIIQKCKKFGISFAEAESKILSHMDFSIEEFVTLSKEEQLSVLYSIDGALGMYILDKSKNKVHSSSDVEALIGETAKNIKLAKEDGGVNTVDEFDKSTSIEDIENKINKASSEDEYAQILEESRISFRRAIELKRVAEIKRCNGNKVQIDEVNRKYEAQIEAFERQRQIRFAQKYGPDKARNSIYLRSGNDYVDAHSTVLNLYSGQTKINVADSFNHDFEIEARKRYYNCGDAISTEAYAEAVELVTQNMSWEALRKFEQDAYEFRTKVKNGEVDAPYMTVKDFEAESVALGKGIAGNINLSDGDKKHLLVKLNNHISNFGNYEKIRALIEENAVISNTKNETFTITSLNTKPDKTEAVKSNGKATPKELEQALFVMSYDEAKKQFTQNSDRDFADVVLHNPKLKSHKQHILGYLKSLSADDLSNLVTGCSTDMFLFVLRNITPDKAGRLYDLSKGEKCYSARKLGEKIIEEGQKNAA